MKKTQIILATGIAMLAWSSFASTPKVNHGQAPQAEVRMVPSFVNGQPAGYAAIKTKKKNAKQKRGRGYSKLGLRNGDVIKSIDGQPVTDPKQAMEQLSRSKNGGGLVESVPGTITELPEGDADLLLKTAPDQPEPEYKAPQH